MEKRFTFKDFFFFALIGAVLVTILLAMYMIDRQWNKMSQMQRTMDEQAQDLRSLRTSIKSLDQRFASGEISQNSGIVRSKEEVPASFKRADSASHNADFQSGDWYVTAFGNGLKTITPLVSLDASASQVQSYVQESLLSRDPDTLQWNGLIAKDWHVAEDGLTFTFQLRDDVTFSDGQKLDADDVMFSFDFMMTEAIAAPRDRAYYNKIESVTATNSHEVVFKFKEPYYNSLALAGGMSILPRHFYEAYLSEPETFNQSKGLLLGSGPYRLKDSTAWTPDQGLVELERNPRYWGAVQPSFDKLLWKVISNDSARLTTYRNGEIDTYGARPREYQKLLDDRDLMARSQKFEYMSPTAGYSYIGWNQVRNGEATIFADKRVRQAMTYLTDRERIIDEIMLGYAEPAVSPFSPRSRQHNAGLKPRAFDLDKAKQLLKEAGYEDRDGNGVLENEAGEPFEFELVFFQDNEDTRRMVLFLKDLYARAGVVLIPKPTEWSVMLDLITKEDYGAITLGWTSGVETDIYQIFHSKQIESGDNFTSYKNERLDTLIEQARGSVNEDERMPLWQEAERIMYEDQPYTFLMRRETLLFVDQRIQNLQNTKLGLNLGFTPVEVYVPNNMQKYGQ